MPKRTLRFTLWMVLLFVHSAALADPEGFPGGGLKPRPIAVVQSIDLRS